MPDAYSFGRGGSGPTNITPPMPGTGNGALAQGLLAGRFGGGMGAGSGSRFAGGVRRKPGIDPPIDPTLSELGGQVGPGGEIYNPETLFSRGGRYGSLGTFTGGQGEENTYDAQGRKTGVKKVDMAPGNFGYHNPNAGLQQLRGYSSALGSYRGRPGAVGGVNQGAGFGAPDDMLKKLLEARMGGGGF